MAGNDIKNWIIDHWDATICAIGEVEYDTLQPEESINYGISIHSNADDYHPAGFTMKQTDAFGGDGYSLTIVGETKDEVQNQLKALIKIADTSNFDTNTVYNKMYPNLNNMSWDPKSYGHNKPTLCNVRKLQVPVMMNKNNVDLY